MLKGSVTQAPCLSLSALKVHKNGLVVNSLVQKRLFPSPDQLIPFSLPQTSVPRHRAWTTGGCRRSLATWWSPCITPWSWAPPRCRSRGRWVAFCSRIAFFSSRPPSERRRAALVQACLRTFDTGCHFTLAFPARAGRPLWDSEQLVLHRFSAAWCEAGVKTNAPVRDKCITIRCYTCHLWRHFAVSPLSRKCCFCLPARSPHCLLP